MDGLSPLGPLTTTTFRPAILAAVAAAIFGCTTESHDFFVPLTDGLAWEYEIQVQRAGGQSVGFPARTSMEGSRTIDGREVSVRKTELTLEGRTVTSFEFLEATELGVAVVAVQEPTDAEPKMVEPRYELRFPLEIGASWEVESRSVFDPEETFTLTRSIEAVDATTTVPAGTFEDCVRVKSVGETTRPAGFLGGKATATIEEISFFCRDIGLVRSVHSEKSDRSNVRTVSLAMQLQKLDESGVR